MNNPPKDSPEAANNVLDNCRALFQETRAQKKRTLLRCFNHIQKKGDYSFLKRLGYKVCNEELCKNAFEKFWVEYDLYSTFLFPFGLFCYFFGMENPLMDFSGESTVNPNLPIITTEELFQILITLPPEQQEEVIQAFAPNANSLSQLRASVQDKDENYFVKIVCDNQIDTTVIGQRLALYKEASYPGAAPSGEDILRAQRYLYRLDPGLAPEINGMVPTSLPVFEGYITKNNCVDNFVKSRELLDPLFIASSRTYFTITRRCEDPKAKLCFSVFLKDPDHAFLVETLHKMGREDVMQYDGPDDGYETLATDSGPHPLQKPPTFSESDDIRNKRVLRLWKHIAHDRDKHWVNDVDRDCFQYLLNLTDIRPRPLRRVTWTGDKWELKCLMEVLYPNRKRKEKPTYGDMAKIFCEENGKQFKLGDTPLQRHKETENDPAQAAREEALIRELEGFLGPL